MSYQPGECNINDREQRKRYFLGSAGFTAAGVLIVLQQFSYVKISSGVVLPLLLFIGFNGFIQGRIEFCAGYGFLGKQKAEGSALSTVPEDSRWRDFLEAVRIQLYSLFGTLAVYGVYAFLPAS